MKLKLYVCFKIKKWLFSQIDCVLYTALHTHTYIPMCIHIYILEDAAANSFQLSSAFSYENVTNQPMIFPKLASWATDCVSLNFLILASRME